MASKLDSATLDACFGEAADPVTVYDRDGRHLYTNAIAEKLLGRARRDVWGRTDRDLELPGDEPRALAALREQVIADGLPRAYESQSAITGRWHEHRISPMRDREGRVVAVTVIAREITTRRRAEEAQQLLAEVGGVLVESLEPRTMLEGLVRTLARAIADGCAVDMLEEYGGYASTILAARDPELERAMQSFRRDFAPTLGSRFFELARERPMLLARLSEEDLDGSDEPARRDAIAKLGIASVATAPMIARGRCVGTLWLLRRDPRRPFDAADLRLAEDAATRAALALDNARLHAMLRVAEGRSREEEAAKARLLESERIARTEAEDLARELRTLADAMPSLVWTTDREGRTTFMSRQWAEYTGSTEWQQWQDRMPPEDLRSTWQAWVECRARGAPGLARFRIRRHDGAERWHVARIVPLRRVEGEVVAWVGIATDIHEELRAKAEAEAILASAPIAISVHRCVEGDRALALASVNDAMRELGATGGGALRPEHDDADRERALGVALPDDADAAMRRVLETGAPLRNVESVLRRTDGSIAHVLANVFPVRVEGEVTGVCAALLDIGEMKRSETSARDALQQRLAVEQQQRLLAELERARFHRLLLHAPALVAILRGPDHVYEFVNERFCEAIPEGRRLVGTSARQHRKGLVEEQFLALLDQVYESGEGYETAEVPIVASGPDGDPQTLFLSFVYQPIHRTDGSIEGIASFAFDVTESVLARKEIEEASRAKDDFLGTLSHELRTPLNAIVGWSHLLRTGALDEPQNHRALEAIDRNAKVQKRLIDDLLDFARMVSGKLGLQIGGVDLASVAESAIDSLRPAALAKNVGISLEVDTRPVIAGDVDRLQQVVQNLLSNAVKFTGPRGQVRVRVRAQDGFARLVVEDDGVGIDPEFLAHVFERFRQADSTTTRRHGGLGLGLAIARSIVELHGGGIEAASEGLGRGTTMSVHIPLRAPLALPVPEHRAPPPLHPARLAAVRVLVVDDEEDARDLAYTVLHGAGAQVRLASSAAEALDALHDEETDVVVSDIGMPGLDGITLIERVRAMPGPIHRVPAIAVTAYAHSEDRARAVGAGYDAFLTKPIDVDELTAVVARVVGRVV
jgi:PAS domain S-box-containing protein